MPGSLLYLLIGLMILFHFGMHAGHGHGAHDHAGESHAPAGHGGARGDNAGHDPIAHPPRAEPGVLVTLARPTPPTTTANATGTPPVDPEVGTRGHAGAHRDHGGKRCC